MVKKSFCAIFLSLICVIFFSQDVMAEMKADYGGSFRLRQEYWENVVDFETLNKPDRDFFRLRSSLWGKVDFNPDLSFYGRITNEARYYLGNYKPFEIISGPPAAVADSDTDRFDEDELVIDSLNVTAKNLFGMPVDLKVGRQDFLGQYGEGFLIVDGTPGDGSRTAYFDAIKLTLNINTSNSVDLIYLNDSATDDHLPSLYPARSDWLPNYYDNKRLLNISDEWGVILYGKSKVSKNFSLEPYYIFKHEDAVEHHYNTAFGGPQTSLDLNTVGARVVLNAANWTIRAEFAHQFGEYDNDRDREANGGYLFVGQKFSDIKFKPEWELGYVYLSGDKNPGNLNGDHEGWDPLFTRCPMWNENFMYPLVYETMRDSGAIPGYWTNLHLVKLGLKTSLDTATNLGLSYQHLWADEEIDRSYLMSKSYYGMFSFDSDGKSSSKDRGHLVTAVLNHAFTKQLNGFLQAEYFIPGDFYSDKADNSVFLRWELQFKF